MKKPPRGTPRGGFVRAGWIATAVASLVVGPAAGGAQVVRGTVTVRQTDAKVVGARVSAHDSAGKPIHEATSDAEGRFTLLLVDGRPFTIAVRKLGWKPSFTDLIRDVAKTDTVELNLEIPAEPPSLPEVDVIAPAAVAVNARRLEEAKRHGWTIIPPEMVEKHRGTAHSFTDLLHATQVQSLIFPSKPADCYRSMRNNRCLTIVIDDQVMGMSLSVAQMQIVSNDIYFFAVLSAAQSGVQYGERAPYGAFVIYTRSYGDRKSR